MPPPPNAHARIMLLRGGADFTLAILLGTVLSLPLLAWRRVLPAGHFSDRLTLLALLLGTRAGFLAVGAWRLVRSPPAGRTPDRGTAPWLAVTVGVTAAAGLLLLGLLYDVLLRVFFGPGAPTIGPWGAVRALPPAVGLAVVAAGVLIVPLAEELFFRARLFRSVADAGRPWLGAAFSAVLFAASSLDLWNLAAYLGLGLALAGVYRLTRSLLAPVVAHGLTNAALFALLFSGYH